MTYRAPVESHLLLLETIGGLGRDVGESILPEAARFAEERLAPLDRDGDRIGAHFDKGAVTLPPGWREAYRDWSAMGWNAIDLPEAYGGMGLPTRLAVVAMEIWTSACMSFALGPVLTQGAVDALERHAAQPLRDAYLPNLVSGAWSATMNLTEPQAGSDLGALRTRALRAADGTYRLTGSRIFISWGEHDLTDNIVHLVLARLPDAPAGTKGISLFLAPKILPDGARNGVICAGVEHKLGIHASPTCSMIFEDATAYLVGEENKGLACMFTMMNKARLYTGLQGVAVADRAYQRALLYAQERRQGRAPGATTTSAIVDHADVRRMLATMRAMTSAGRALAIAAAAAIDAGDEERAGLLTPIVKAWCSDMGFAVASLGVQVHGGMGYVEETGAAQHLRDARIPPIYEGTNGIQAIDLLLRKVRKPGDAAAADAIYRCRRAATRARESTDAELARAGASAARACDALSRATERLLGDMAADDLLWAATPYLRLWGVTLGASLLLEAALALRDDQAPAARRLVADAIFFAEHLAPAAEAEERAACAQARYVA